ncbi:MAG: beta-lactamase family protein [Maribacter sp.]|nr:beta-lactamase family protein [Maribacter sp.]
MRRLKIFGGTSLFLLTFFVVIAFRVASTDLATKTETAAVVKPKVNVAELRAAERYGLRKQQLESAIRHYFDNAITSGTIVGAGVSIVQGDSIVISEGFGKRNIKGTAEIDGQTIFRLGSLSKGFTGLLAASLQAEGTLNWNDKVVDFIPDFRLGDQRNTQKVTLAHILSHTSGTPYHSYTNLVEAGLPMANIAKRFKEVNPISEPGKMYSYQNAMFALSQEVMREATGKEINTLLRDRFFKPLRMTTASTDYLTLNQAENVALPHSKRKGGWKILPLNKHYYNAVAAGGINASALDMGKWMHFLLGHNTTVLQHANIEKAFTPIVKIGNNNKYYQRWPGHAQSYYGMGWRIHTFQDDGAGTEKTIWHHGGSVNNYRNEIALYPEADLGICVLLNGQSRLAQTVIPDLYEIITTGSRESSEIKP